MAKWGSAGSLTLRDTGEPANACAMVGSAFDLALVYLDSDGNPSSLDGWRLSATGAFHMAEWSDDDRLIEIVSARMTEPAAVAAEALDDQGANPGAFLVSTAADAVPPHLRDVPIESDLLPTLAAWVRLEGPNGTVEQARIAIGFRRGADSMS